MNEEFEPVAINAFRRATGNENAIFKSEEQRTAMGEVWKSQQDVAVLLRTGGGKTAVILGPALLEKTVTLWVLLFALWGKTAQIALRNKVSPPWPSKI